MSPDNLVPGISKYPDLARQLSIRMGTSGRGCTSCLLRSLSREFQKKLKDRVERDKITGRQ